MGKFEGWHGILVGSSIAFQKNEFDLIVFVLAILTTCGKFFSASSICDTCERWWTQSMIVSNIWAYRSGEWKGAKKPFNLLLVGLVVLIIASVILGYSNSLS